MSKSKVKIYDNFLTKEEWKIVHHFFFRAEDNAIHWRWSPSITGGKMPVDKETGQFTAGFFYADEGVRPGRDLENWLSIAPVLNAIRFTEPEKSDLSWLRVKANLNPCACSHNQLGAWHQDFPIEGATTAIFYLNTNNGWTQFEDGTKVESVANRLVTFPATYNHVGFACTDKSVRIVLNINYIKYHQVNAYY